jgi:hypothetical protein
MKGYLVDGNPVNAGFGLGNPQKNIQRPFLRPFPQGGSFQKQPYILPRMMAMFVVMAVFMAVLMFVIVFMIARVVILMVRTIMFVMFMAMFVVMAVRMVMAVMFAGVMPVFVPVKYHNGAGAGDAVPLVPAEFQFPAFKAELAQLAAQFVRIHAQIHQGAQRHVAGYAGETVKVKYVHDTPRPSLSRGSCFP